MNTYLDVGVLRIQAYLSRSKRLRARARASGGISERSERYSSANRTDSDAALAELVGGDTNGWRFNEELGKVDGVVSLVHAGPVSADAAGRSSACRR